MENGTLRQRQANRFHKEFIQRRTALGYDRKALYHGTVAPRGKDTSFFADTLFPCHHSHCKIVATGPPATSVFNMTSYQTNSQKDTRTQFERIVLLLQGSGALGSYQAGVYQALAEADLHPNWVAGISIGAINAAIIAGNAPDKRVDRLREFWETVSTSTLGIPYFKSIELQNAFVHHLVNQGRAVNILLFGVANFFTPRVPPATL
jgi:hypothetical protein